LDFPTIIFYQTGYSIFTLRQASRRSWRIGQDKPVRIHYLHYRGTMQERALELVGKKLSASLAIEGKLTADGLASMSAGEDMTP
jgi:SNF2 family DNA or RNA helicase